MGIKENLGNGVEHPFAGSRKFNLTREKKGQGRCSDSLLWAKSKDQKNPRESDECFGGKRDHKKMPKSVEKKEKLNFPFPFKWGGENGKNAPGENLG